MQKDKSGKEEGSVKGGIKILIGVHKDLTEKVMSEQTPEGDNGLCQTEPGEEYSRKGSSQYKGPETDVCLAYLKSGQRLVWLEQIDHGKGVGNEVSETVRNRAFQVLGDLAFT